VLAATEHGKIVQFEDINCQILDGCKLFASVLSLGNYFISGLEEEKLELVRPLKLLYTAIYAWCYLREELLYSV